LISSGTIYPALKSLVHKGLIKEVQDGNREKKYELTVVGKKELAIATKKFVCIFCDMKKEF